jgi:hypothetical protein
MVIGANMPDILQPEGSWQEDIMIEKNSLFVSIYDGYAIEMRVESFNGKTAKLIDSFGERHSKLIKQKPNYKPSFMHGGHLYLLTDSNFSVEENNRLKL